MFIESLKMLGRFRKEIDSVDPVIIISLKGLESVGDIIIAVGEGEGRSRSKTKTRIFRFVQLLLLAACRSVRSREITIFKRSRNIPFNLAREGTIHPQKERRRSVEQRQQQL